MKLKLLAVLIAIAAPVFAQETDVPEAKKGRQFWLHAGAETAGYGRGRGMAFGGGLQAGYSIWGGAFSAKAAWLAASDGESVLELTLIARFWLGSDPFSGFFYQFQAGAVFFAPNAENIFGENGKISATLSFLIFGYRIPLGKRFYIEPVVRTGYPYLIGASLSAGVRF